MVRRTWTVDEFLAWEGHADGRYEFDGSEPVAMTGGSLRHALVIRNLQFALNRRLLGGPCQFPGPDAGLATTGQAIRYPDALVTCTPQKGDATTLSGAVVVFEVLSPGSGRIDRIVKVREYAAVPSLRRYAILEYRSAGLTVLSRDGREEAWRTTTLSGGDVLHMPEIGIEIPVADFYAGVDFSA